MPRTTTDAASQPTEQPANDKTIAQPERVADGIWRLPLPMKAPPGHINSWLLEDESGWFVVDCGTRSKDTRDAWQAFMQSPLYRDGITRIFLTHAHPDHIGSAAWLARETGAPVLMAEAERQAMLDLAVDMPTRNEELTTWLSGWDADEKHITQCQFFYQHFSDAVPVIHSDIHLVTAGETLSVNNKVWQLHEGLGHTPCNILLHQAEQQWLITGDQILPDIVTNISTWWRQDKNPLGLYLSSLKPLSTLAVELALPAHGDPFSHYHERCKQLETVHAQRLTQLTDVIQTGHTSIADILKKLGGKALYSPLFLLVAGQIYARIALLLAEGKITETTGEDGLRAFSVNSDDVSLK
jgi:glyoxylase-like metal-dependent hydrolase (beta-lactamase superfamily II)